MVSVRLRVLALAHLVLPERLASPAKQVSLVRLVKLVLQDASIVIRAFRELANV